MYGGNVMGKVLNILCYIVAITLILSMLLFLLSTTANFQRGIDLVTTVKIFLYGISSFIVVLFILKNI